MLKSFSGRSDFSPFMNLYNRLHLLLRSCTSPQFWMGRMMSNNQWMPKNRLLVSVLNMYVNVSTHMQRCLKPVFRARASCAAACAVCTYWDRIRQQQSLSVYVARPTLDKCLLSCWTYKKKKEMVRFKPICLFLVLVIYEFILTKALVNIKLELHD